MEQNEILSKLRKNKGLTLEELSSKTGISKNMLWHLEKGDRTGTIETLKKLSEFYQVSLDYITNNSERVKLVDDFIQELIDKGIITNSNDIDKEMEEKLLNFIKTRVDKLT
ncbi:helix-turn-helix domain-containing protein [Clostridium sporogenes]|uniref:helix-turn-helix domain-containing protein n=1 Tax=Clostridium sporogenes TaxID=1509 RepID=UPI00024BA2BE|nr:helix-turn-helix transcriptional regulator [Clostridium sporogenes]EHN17118.1 DNA-binding protein [Clostridium sporogenes PA 3679]NFQ36268.1 helix-turn-helix transcriptional regulator [Clostridium sporogenes]NFQ61985.1 helix-turn-helix transcriptional regulator [Clostridium sporogenes]NFU11659.1 helix-turn-helix transcriptional regulator [Clostridium sporogenes]NFU45232.1 helix-turn-helix transcriptional regulator [Clostridium sporogenes]